MKTTLSVARGALSLGSARFVVNLLNALGILVLARLLTPSDFGIVAIATAVLTVVASFTEVSLQPALVQCRNPTQEHIDTVWTMSFMRAVLIFAIFMVAAFPLSLIYNDPRLLPVFLVTGLTGALFDFYNPLVTLSTRYMRFGPLTKFQIAQKLIGLVLAAALALYLRNFWAIIIGNAVGALVASLLSYAIVPYRPRFTLSRFSEIWEFSRWLFFNQLCETLNWRYDQLVIGTMVPAAAVGQYAMADNLAVIPSRELTNPMRNALFPGMVSVNQQPDALRWSFMRSQGLMAMVTAPLALGLALVAGPAVLVILGPAWEESTVYVQLFALAYMLDSFTSAVRPLAMATGMTKMLFIRQLVTLLVRIPLITAGLVLGGLIGAAAGAFASSIFQFVIGITVASRLLNLPLVRILYSHRWTYAGLGLMTAAVTYYDQHVAPLIPDFPIFKLLSMTLVGAVVYAGTIFSLWLAGGKRESAVSELINIIQALISSALPRKRAQ